MNDLTYEEVPQSVKGEDKEYVMGRFNLTGHEWAIIEPHFPKAGRGLRDRMTAGF